MNKIQYNRIKAELFTYHVINFYYLKVDLYSFLFFFCSKIDQTAVAVDHDCLEQYIYWSDVSGKLINKVKSDGSKYEVVLQGLLVFFILLI